MAHQQVMEMEMDEVIEKLPTYDDSFVLLCIDGFRGALKEIDPKMRTTFLPSHIRKMYNFFLSYVSAKRPHLCRHALEHDNLAYLSRRRCLSCRDNKPCEKCNFKTPINIINNKTPSTRLPFRCSNDMHVCQRCHTQMISMIHQQTQETQKQ